MLVLLNPRGGKGKGLQLFRSHVQPRLAQADVSYRLMLTGECPRPQDGAPTDRTLLHSRLVSPSCPLERRNHARELVRMEELGRWDALVVMSGDGLMHEVRPAAGGCAGGGAGRSQAEPGSGRGAPPQVVNGLMERPDWETAIRKPLCSLPAGSGNALAASVNHYAG